MRPDELRLLAIELIGRRLSDPHEWAHWDLVPGLAEVDLDLLHEELLALIDDLDDSDEESLAVWRSVQ